jgi:hypothetical protein
MHYRKISKLQEDYGVAGMQRLINDGSVWHMEGSYGREAMRLLESGQCMLPKKQYKDFYGNVIPSRDNIKPGTTGSYQNACKYWDSIHDYDAMYV